MPPPPDNLHLYNHPLIPAGYPYLQLNQGLCMQRLQHTLCDAATNSTYFDYLSGKFCGILHPATDIHWHLLRNSLKWFKSTERHTLTKFIHEWLPLQDCHQTQSLSHDRSCPSCHQASETTTHFLACPHASRLQVWKELHNQLHQHQLRNATSNIFHDLLAFGLYTGCQEPTTISLHRLPSDIQSLYNMQEGLGWTQLYYGRFPPVGTSASDPPPTDQWHHVLLKMH